MNAEQPSRVAYRFDRFTLDLSVGALVADGGAQIPLRPKSFALLRLLVENAGRLLDRDAIMEAVWPDVMVTDDSITQCVRDIRNALGGEAQQVLRTVPRRGYRFDAAVSKGEPTVVMRDDIPSPVVAFLTRPETAPQTVAREVPALTARAERRQLTVMFVDLVGSTALSHRLDPEDMQEVLRTYRNAVVAEARSLGGHVARYMGDGLIVYFGWPTAYEDAAERAVRAGLAIAAAVGRIVTNQGGRLAARVGIATGLVVVGDLIGEGASHGEDVVGETPNLAARLQQIAAPGTVVIATATRALVGQTFDLDDLGEEILRGIPGQVRSYRVRSEGRISDRFEAHQSQALLPLIGRSQELALLQERWRQAGAGEGQVVVLSGEAGIGKSRIAQALLEVVAAEPHARVRLQCSPYLPDSALHPAIQHLERAAGFTPDDGTEAKLDKLERMLAEVLPDPAPVTPLMAALLGLDGTGRHGKLDLTPQQQRSRTLQALVVLLLGLASREPVLFVVEDAHWIDPTTLELLDICLDPIVSARVLLLITARPTFTHGFGGHPIVTRLALNRLGRNETAAIVNRVAGGRTLPGVVLDEIAAKADGVPLFIEELTKTVLESGLLRATDKGFVVERQLSGLTIPTTLHDSLMARLDRLNPIKEVAQTAACIGREFSYGLLSAVLPLPEGRLDDALDQLVAAELVFRRGAPPDASYSFKHALVQDAAGASLLRGRRQQLHARIAGTLEEHFPEAAAAAPELLAHHWAKAGSISRAVELWAEAGERALARAANREASGFFERALAALDGLDETPELLTRIFDLRRSLYNALYKFGELHRTRTNLVEAERLAARLNDSTRLCRILVDMTYILGCTGDITGAIASGERAVASAAEGEDLEACVQSRVQLARSLYARGRYPEAIDHIRDVIEMLGEDVPRGRLGPELNQTISARVWLVLFHAELGEFAACAALAAEAGRLAAQVEGAWGTEGQVWLWLALGRSAVLQGNFMEAVETLEPALAPCESEFVIYFSRVASSLGIAHARLGHLERGVALLRQAVVRDQAIGFGFRFGLQLAQLGEALLLAGDADGALDAGMRALEAARNSGEEAGEGWALHLLGDIAARRDRPGAAARYREALDIAERLDMAPLRTRCLEGLGGLAGACSAVVVNYPGFRNGPSVVKPLE